MGRVSTKKNKNIYQISRENAGLTREKAEAVMDYINADRIVRIENGSPVQPDEVLTMAKCYKQPELSNYYCSHECPIGQQYIPEIKIKDLSQIVLETVTTLNSLEMEKNRLMEIAVDGKISPDELEDFKKISEKLSRISLAVDSLELWVERTIAKGELEI